jgi:hypothetical protein
MEALLEREEDVENWNDERLDELSGRMDAGFKEMREGFARVDRETKEGFEKVDRDMKGLFGQLNKRMDRFEDRIERLTNTFMVVGGGFAAAVVAATIFG